MFYNVIGEIQVPGLPQRYNWWTASELCSVAIGNLFHVSNRTQWDEINNFLIGLGNQLHDHYILFYIIICNVRLGLVRLGWLLLSFD